MAKTNDEGEQMDLIPDLRGENAKEVARIARRYKKAQGARNAALKDEVKEKEKLIAALKESKVKPIDGGVIKVRIEGLGTITVTPRDELVRVKYDDGSGEAED